VENIFVDPLVQPLSVDNTFGVEFINTIEKIVSGLSGHPHGLRAEQHFLRTAGQKVHEPDLHDHGDCQGPGRGHHQPAGQAMMANIIAAEALAGRDNFCMNYLKAFRAC
jgi:hypothetical protein